MAVKMMTLSGCAVLFLVLSFARMSLCSKWWSLGFEDTLSQKVVDSGSVLCDQLHNVLNTTQQQSFCLYNKEPLNYIAIGTRNGIVACQEGFSKSLWNCTTFDGNHLFGSFVDQDTKETAAINALLAAGGIRRIARACKDEVFSNCTCRAIKNNGFFNGSFYTYDCAYDVQLGEKAIMEFLNQTITDSSSAVAHQNYKVGAHYVKQMESKCRCVGFSGACSAQACHYRSPKMETIAETIRKIHLTSVQVRATIHNNVASLAPIISGVSFNVTTDLVYLENTPSLCTQDSTKGILGTVGRPCNISHSALDSCNVICCGRGYNIITKTVSKECCRFVFCCRIECEECGTNTFTTYQCK